MDFKTLLASAAEAAKLEEGRSALLADLPLSAVLEHFGHDGEVGEVIPCPLPGHPHREGKERTPSFSMFMGETKAQWKCHGCGQRGDALDLIRALAPGRMAAGAALKLAYELLDNLPAERKRVTYAPVPCDHQEMAKIVGMSRKLGCVSTQGVYRSLFPVASTDALSWIERQFSLGILSGTAVIPHWDQQRRIWGIRFRDADGKRSYPGSRMTHSLYGAWRDHEAEFAILCEGESDVWAVAEAYRTVGGVDVFGAPSGAGSVVSQEGIELLRGRRVALLFDPDSAGYRGEQLWAKALSGIAAEVRHINLPPLDNRYLDARDYIQKRGPERFREDVRKWARTR